MPYFLPGVVQKVKQIDLLTYLKTYELYEFVRFSGNTYTTRTHDSLKISNGRWRWWSRGDRRQNIVRLSHKSKRLHVLGGHGAYHREGIHTASSSITSRKRNGEEAVTAGAKPLSNPCCQLSEIPGNRHGID